MMRLLGTIALGMVVIAATAVITKHSDGILSAFTSWTDSSSQVPGVVPFQGVLSDSTGGLAADGDYTVTFAFYSAAGDGAPLWTETQVVTTTDGLFNTQPGNTDPATPSDVTTDNLWSSITVGLTAVSPRRTAGTATHTPVNASGGAPRAPGPYPIRIS